MPDNQTTPPVTVTLEAGPAYAGSIDDFELFYARRAVDRFRTLLGRQGLLDLLAADIETGNAFLRESASPPMVPSRGHHRARGEGADLG